MAKTSPAARLLAEHLTSCEIPVHSAQHVAVRAARVEQDAQLIARVADLAGISPEKLVERLACNLAEAKLEESETA